MELPTRVSGLYFLSLEPTRESKGRKQEHAGKSHVRRGQGPMRDKGGKRADERNRNEPGNGPSPAAGQPPSRSKRNEKEGQRAEARPRQVHFEAGPGIKHVASDLPAAIPIVRLRFPLSRAGKRIR